MRPLRGFVGQSMSGRRREPRPVLYKIVDVSSAGAGEITVDFTGYAQLFLWGAGGSGNASTGGGRVGGGAGGALYIDGPVNKGQSIAYLLGAGGASVTADASGNAGADSTLTFGGLTYRAGGGGAGGGSVGAGGVGQPQGRAITRTGANGGTGSANAPTGEDGGGSGGGFDANNAGGGGAAGFGSLITGLTYGVGSTGSASATNGAGGGGTSNGTSSGRGGHGRIVAYLFRFD